MLNRYLILIFILTCTNLFAQKKLKFQSKEDYLNFLNLKFDIEKSNVYSHGAVNDSAYIGRVSLMVFVKGSMMTTVEEMQEKEKNLCPPKKFMNFITTQRIEDEFTKNIHVPNIFFKNIETSSNIFFDNNITALFFFSYKFGKNGLQYYKNKEYLEKLNIKCIIVTLDESEINGLANKKSEKVILN